MVFAISLFTSDPLASIFATASPNIVNMDSWYRQAMVALLESKIQHCDELLTAVTYCILAERQYLLLETPNGLAKDIHSLSFSLEQMNSVLGLSTCIVSVMEDTQLSEVMSGFLQRTTTTHSKDNSIAAERTAVAIDKIHTTMADGIHAMQQPHPPSAAYGSTMGILGGQAQQGSSSGSSSHCGTAPGSSSTTASTTFVYLQGQNGANCVVNAPHSGIPTGSSATSAHQKSESQTNQPAASTSSTRGDIIPGHKKSNSQTNTSTVVVPTVNSSTTTSTANSNVALESPVAGGESDIQGQSVMRNSSSSSFGQSRPRLLRHKSSFRSKPTPISQESSENSTHLMHMESDPSHHPHQPTTASDSITPSDLSFQIGGGTRHQHQNSISAVSSNITKATHAPNKCVANVVVLEILERISSEFFLALLEVVPFLLDHREC